MKHQHKLLLNGLIGLIVIIITLVVFFVGFSVNAPKQTIDYLALLFVLISEIALFGVTLVLIAHKDAGDKLFVHSGVMSILVIYWLITTALSIFVNSFFKGNAFGFITIQVIIMGVAAIILISLFLAASNIHDKNARALGAGMILQECENIIFSLLNNPQYQKIAGQLNQLYEELKYSEHSTCLPEQEIEIRLKINELSDRIKAAPLEETVITEAVNKIMVLIKVRNMAVKQSKGGYC